MSMMKQKSKYDYVTYLKNNGVKNPQGEDREWLDKNMKEWKRKHQI